MQFTAYPPHWTHEKLMGDIAWRIFATGEIDANADKRLAALITSKTIPQASLLFLHSPGGSPVGGMALGRLIRANRLHTFIGQFALLPSDPKSESSPKYVGYWRMPIAPHRTRSNRHGRARAEDRTALGRPLRRTRSPSGHGTTFRCLL
jgi:hypothetical protein